MTQLAPENDAAGGDEDVPRRGAERGTVSLPAGARRRAAMMGPLAAQDAVSIATARDAGQALGLSERTIYVLLRH